MKSRSLAAVCAALLMALAGCSSNSGSGASGSAEANSTDKGTVTVLTHDSFAVPKDLITTFEKESGYKVTTTAPGDAGTVVNQLVLANGKPGADAVYGIDTFTAEKAVKAGVLEDYASPKLPEGRSAEEGALNPIDDGFVAVNADKAYFEENNLALPTTFADLAKPEYSKLLVTENPASSSPGLAFLAGSISSLNGTPEASDNFASTPAGDYWKTLTSGGTKIEKGWSDAYYSSFSASEKKGPYPLVVSYSSSPAAEDGKTVSINGTAVKQTEYAAVLKGAKNPEGAKAFIDFLLSDDVQKSIPDNMYMRPVVDVPLPDAWVELAPAPKDPIVITPAVAGENVDRWIKGWRDVAGR